MRLSLDSLICIMEISIPVRRHLYTETDPTISKPDSGHRMGAGEGHCDVPESHCDVTMYDVTVNPDLLGNVSRLAILVGNRKHSVPIFRPWKFFAFDAQYLTLQSCCSTSRYRHIWRRRSYRSAWSRTVSLGRPRTSCTWSCWRTPEWLALPSPATSPRTQRSSRHCLRNVCQRFLLVSGGDYFPSNVMQLNPPGIATKLGAQTVHVKHTRQQCSLVQSCPNVGTVVPTLDQLTQPSLLPGARKGLTIWPLIVSYFVVIQPNIFIISLEKWTAFVFSYPLFAISSKCSGHIWQKGWSNWHETMASQFLFNPLVMNIHNSIMDLHILVPTIDYGYPWLNHG